jgi:hypothetical protein
LKLTIPSSEEVKNKWSHTCTKPYACMAWAGLNFPLLLRIIAQNNSSRSNQQNTCDFFLEDVYGSLKYVQCHYLRRLKQRILEIHQFHEECKQSGIFVKQTGISQQCGNDISMYCSQHGNNYFMGCFSGCGNGRGCVEEGGGVCRNGR